MLLCPICGVRPEFDRTDPIAPPLYTHRADCPNKGRSPEAWYTNATAPVPATKKMLRIWVTHVAVIDAPMPDDFDLGGWITAVRGNGYFFTLDRKTYIRAEDISLAAVLEVTVGEQPKEGKILPFTVLPGGAA